MSLLDLPLIVRHDWRYRMDKWTQEQDSIVGWIVGVGCTAVMVYAAANGWDAP